MSTRPTDDGLLVRVTTRIDPKNGEPIIAMWLVATTNRQVALAAVWEANPLARKVELSKRAVQPGTIRLLQLYPGEARKL